MRKQLLLVILFISAIGLALSSPVSVIAGSDNSLELTENSSNLIKLEYSLNSLDIENINDENGEYIRLIADNFGYTGKHGQPQLPSITKIISVPMGARLDISITNQKKEIINLREQGFTNPIFPNQPSVSKSAKPEDIKFVIDNKIYSSNEVYTLKLVETEEIGMMRGYRLFEISYNPISYNIAKNELIVTRFANVEVNFIGGDYSLTDQMREKTYSRAFEGMFAKTILNYRNDTRYLENYPLGYLIVTPQEFLDTLEPFILWKKESGFDVTILTTEAVGSTSSAIKSEITSIWNSANASNPAPSYLLIVGDVAQVPAWDGQTESGHVTDLDYVKLEGSDYLPEMYYGRFSATSVAELQTQVNKTLMYEKFEMSDPSYLERVTLIAGVDASWAPTHGNGTINYGSTYYFNSAHGIDATTYLYPASGSSESQIFADVNEGLGYLNYTAHGSETSWADPNMTISDINSFTNNEMYPVVVGNCCLTNHFDTGTCFGEAWLRAENGAVIYIGGTNSTLWDEDYWWSVGYFADTDTDSPTYAGTGTGMFDALFHENGQAFDTWANTAGAMVYSGNMAVQSSSSSDKNYYWEIYSIMGDPSLNPYIGLPETQTANYQSNVFIGATSLDVSVAPYSYVAISRDGVLLGSALANSSGSASVDFDALDTTQNLKIVVTHTDYSPHIGTIEVVPAEGPYLSVSAYSFNTSDNDEIVEYGESCSLNLTISNAGVADSPSGTITFTESSQYITITDNSESISSVNDGSSIQLNNVCSFNVVSNLPDNSSIEIDYEIVSGSDTYNGQINFSIASYNITLQEVTIDDSQSGNGNNIIDAGETFDFVVSVRNQGGAQSPIGTLAISSMTDITCPTSVNVPTIDAGVTETINIQCTSSSFIEAGREVIFNANTTYPNGSSSLSDTFIANLLIIGQGTETETHLPLEPYYGYTYSQSIYTSDELNLGSCAINKISYNWNKNSSFTDEIKLYLGHTTDASFSSTTDWFPVSQLTEVYAGDFSVNTSDDWVEIEFTIPFNYNGTSNLVIAIDENTSGYHASSDEFYCFTTSSNQSIYYYSDSTNPDPASPPTGNPTAYKPNIRVFPSESTNEPLISVNTTSLDYGDVVLGESVTKNFTITNNGGSDLVGNVILPTGFNLANRGDNKDYISTRLSTIPYTITAGNNQEFNIIFSPTTELCYNNNIEISHNAEGSSKYISLVACGVKPQYSADNRMFNKVMNTDETDTESLTITNSGSGTLDVVIDIADVDRNSGGPDTYGYTWIDSNETSLEYNWIDISSTGTVIAEEDDGVSEIDLPFTFSFYGEDYTSLSVCSNGFLNLAGTEYTYTNTSIPNSNTPNAIIAPYWDDLKPIGLVSDVDWGNVYYQNFTDYTVIQWENVSHYNSSTPTDNLTFQVILYANGNILMQYKTIATQTDYTVGIENHNGDDGLLIGFDQVVLSDEYAILFTLDATIDWLAIDMTEISLAEGESQTVTLSFNTMNYENGTYNKIIQLVTNDPDNEWIEIPVALLIGTVSQAAIEVDVESIDMATVFLNSLAQEEFSITNSGGEDLIIQMSVDDGFVIEEITRRGIGKSRYISSDSKMKKSNRNINITIPSAQTKNFSCSHPTNNVGIFSSSISIISNAINEPNISIPVSLEVIEPASIIVNPTSISKNLRPSTQDSLAVTITNDGDVELNCVVSLDDLSTRDGDILYSHNFDDDDLSDWSITYESSADYTWQIVTDRGGETLGNDSFLLIDSDEAGSGVSFNDIAETPLIDVSNYETVTIEFDQYFRKYQAEIADVDFWNGTEWTNIASYSGSDVGTWASPNHFSYQITNEGYSQVKFRFHYYDADYDWYWAIDNLVITGQGNIEPQWVSLDSNMLNVNVAPNSSEDFWVYFNSTDFEDGDYYTNIQIQSNSAENSNLDIPVHLNITSPQNEPSWEAVIYPNNSATIYGQVELYNIPAEEGDILGVFVGDECRAVADIVEADGNAYVALVVQCANPNENVSFKLYDYSEDLVCILSNATTINPGENVGSANNPFLISMGQEELIAPNNISIQVEGANTHLSWNAIPYATEYLIEYSTNYHDWSILTTTNQTNYTLTQSRFATEMYLFRITARK